MPLRTRSKSRKSGKAKLSLRVKSNSKRFRSIRKSKLQKKSRKFRMKGGKRSKRSKRSK